MVELRTHDNIIPARWQEAGAHILYDPAQLDQPSPVLFDPAYWQHQGSLQPTSAGRGSSWFIRTPAADWVLRQYRRGGLPGRLIRHHYVWLGLARARPVAEWQLLAALYNAGLPVPRPVAAWVQRHGGFYTGAIITTRLDALPLSALLMHSELDTPLWRAIGRCIRRFHVAGVWHADLNAHNILLDKRGAVFLLDFDKGRHRAGTSWQADNLARLARSLAKILPAERWMKIEQTGWQELLAGYAGDD